MVVYKGRPALAVEKGDRLELTLPDGARVKVRPKDVLWLHPGPASLELNPPEGEEEAAWELLQGQVVDLKDLAELVYGAYTPETAYGAYLLAQRGERFLLEGERVRARTREEVEALLEARRKREEQERRFQEGVRRLREGVPAPEDRSLIQEVEAMALGERRESRVLRALRQELDLYACVRPVRWFKGVPSPVKHPELVNMVIFRENTEDIYAGIEWPAGSEEVQKVLDFLKREFPKAYAKIRFPETSGIGIKPVSKEGTERLVDAAIAYAIKEDLPSVTLVHKGNIMKFTEGAFREWGYALAREKYGATPLDGGPWHVLKNPRTGREIVIKDMIADNFLQQILLRPDEYSVIATLNLNGDYISDALAAQVGGIGIAPGANINYQTGHAVFEATHGTAPKYAGQDKVNPSSVILSGEMMLRYMGWNEAADLIIQAMERTIAKGLVTYDFHRLLQAEGKPATLLRTSEFGRALIEHM